MLYYKLREHGTPCLCTLTFRSWWSDPPNSHHKQNQTKPGKEVTFHVSPKDTGTEYAKIYGGVNVQSQRTGKKKKKDKCG